MVVVFWLFLWFYKSYDSHILHSWTLAQDLFWVLIWYMSIKPFQRKWSTTLIKATTIIRDWRALEFDFGFYANTSLIGFWRQLIFRQRQVSFFTFSSALLKEVKCPPRRESEILPRLDYSLSVSDPSSVPVTFTLLVGPLFCNLLYTDIQMPLLISSDEFEYQFDWPKLCKKKLVHKILTIISLS